MAIEKVLVAIRGKAKKGKKKIGGGKIQLYIQEKNLHEIIILFL